MQVLSRCVPSFSATGIGNASFYFDNLQSIATRFDFSLMSALNNALYGL